MCDILPTIGCSCQICPHRQASSGADLTGNFQINFGNLISGNNSRPKGCNAGFISDVNARSFHEERYEAKLKQSPAIPARYDKPKVNFVGAIYFAVTALGIN